MYIRLWVFCLEILSMAAFLRLFFFCKRSPWSLWAFSADAFGLLFVSHRKSLIYVTEAHRAASGKSANCKLANYAPNRAGRLRPIRFLGIFSSRAKFLECSRRTQPPDRPTSRQGPHPGPPCLQWPLQLRLAPFPSAYLASAYRAMEQVRPLLGRSFV